jgi:hypothetical protein
MGSGDGGRWTIVKTMMGEEGRAAMRMLSSLLLVCVGTDNADTAVAPI